MTETLVGARGFSGRSRRRPLVRPVASNEAVPRLRGVSHEKAFAFAPALGLVLVLAAETPRALVAGALYGATLTAMLGVSAVNHRASLDSRWKPWLRRLDHTTVNLFLAGTWASFALLVLPGPTRLVLTVLVCAGALAASVVTLVWVDVPGWVPASIGLASGWSAALILPRLDEAAGAGAVGLFLAGGFLYTAGAVVYALRRPNPLPDSLGYHEIFHALVLGGAACHYLAHVLYVVPLAS